MVKRLFLLEFSFGRAHGLTRAMMAVGRPSAPKKRENRLKTRPMKPFHGIHETIPKQMERTSLANRWRPDASEASHEPLNSLC
jgi:hypothetical protein